MTQNCTGNGECFEQSCCHDNEQDSEVCVSEDRNHILYFSREDHCSHNCKLIECHNYRLCKQKRPQYLLTAHGGMCVDCAMMIGKIIFLDEKADCPVCLENKDMVQISCEKHRVCLQCWKRWSEKSEQTPLTCPLCRKGIWEIITPFTQTL